MALLRGAALACVVVLTACGGDDGPSTSLPDCAGVRDYDVIAYHLDARFDWDTQILHASESISLQTATSPIVVFDADVDVLAVHREGKPFPYVVDRDAHTLTVDLSRDAIDGDPAGLTVEYTAGTSDALVVVGARDDDPVASRVVYTDSEPDRGLRWLVGKHDPSDRAMWSSDITVPPDHDVISNGTRFSDVTSGGERHVVHQLPEGIPTYLMAFAAGELDHVDRPGPVPLSLWFRRGLSIVADDNLDAVADAMETFAGLIGEYPWDRYAVVLLPGFGGGMENATITFNDESSGQGAVSFSLNAHELAHQWFGDWVTMRHYDDVWIKEGMASFLASEAQRATRDLQNTGRAFGVDFRFTASHAIVDPTLTGLDKYTTGPYQRAAWLLTQIRALVGDEAFWGALVDVLHDHARGDVDGAEMLAAFPLSEAQRARLLASLTATGVPAIAVETTAVTGATVVSFTLSDPTATLTAAVDVAAIRDTGSLSMASLLDGSPTDFTVPDGGYLAPDPRGLHPFMSGFFISAAGRALLRPMFVPTAGPALADFLVRSPSHQEVALASASITLPPPAAFAAFYDALDSVNAQRSALIAACTRLRTLAPPDDAVLAAALRPHLTSPPMERYANFAACGPALAEALFGAELDTLAPSAATATRLEYLISFDYGAAASLDRIGRIATTAPSLRLRNLALDRLVNQTYSFTAYTPLETAADRTPWAAFFRARLPLTTTAPRVSLLWTAAANLGDVDALPLVAPLFHTVAMSDDLQRQIICDAFFMTLDQPARWDAFRGALQLSDLQPAAAAALADPSALCAAQKRSPAPAPDDAADHQRLLRAR